MPLSDNINTREFDKFGQNTSDETFVRTSATGTFSASGLKVAGKSTKVILNSTTWTALPAIALTARNALRVQNQSSQRIFTAFDISTANDENVWIDPSGSDMYDITGTIVIYARSTSGAANVVVQEFS